jgi:GDPmannose 4,6-dehydratase
LLEKFKPDEFYNLAAQSSVGLSFEQPIGTFEIYYFCCKYFEAIRIVDKKINLSILQQEMYGNVAKENFH